MSNYVFYGLFITILVIILGFVFRKSKFVGFIQILWLILLMGFNTGGGDYSGNLAIFNLSNLNYTSLFNGELYKILCFFFKSNGYDYFITNMIFNIISIIILYIFIRKNTSNKNFVLSLFMIFPMFDFIMQKRSFLALPFILIFFYCLSLDRFLISLIVILIASQIHSSSYYFLIILLLYYIYERIMKKENFDKFIYILTLFIFVFSSFISKYLSTFFGMTRISLYFSSTTISLTSSLAWIFIHLFFVVLLNIISKHDVKLNDREKEFENFTKILNMCSLTIIPLYFYESVFFRLFKVILILNYVCIANRIKKDLNKKTLMDIYIYVLFIIFIFILLYILTGYGFDVLIKPLFDNNEFIRWLLGGY